MIGWLGDMFGGEGGGSKGKGKKRKGKERKRVWAVRGSDKLVGKGRVFSSRGKEPEVLRGYT